MRGRPLAGLASIGALVLLALAPSTAWASDPPPAQRSTGPLGPPAAPTAALPSVELAIVGASSDADLVEDRVASWFHGQGIVARAARLPSLEPSTILAPTDRVGVRVWIVLGEPKSAQVFFVVQERAGQGPRYLVNNVALDNGLDELGVEQLAQVVYFSSVALWAGNVESSRSDVEQELAHRSAAGAPAPRGAVVAPPAPPLSPSREARAREPGNRTSVRVGAEYAAILTGAEGVAQTVGATVSVVGQRFTLEQGARLRAAIVLPRHATKSGVELDLRGMSFGLGFISARKVADRTWIPAELGLGIDLLRYRTGTVDTSYQAAPGGLDARPIAYGRWGVRVDLGAVRIGVDALVNIQLVRTRYEISAGGERAAILVPWVVQPGLSAGASW
jgi:hypothetical protein